jgi:Cof subfamily protein (haloacid dehalogenase superfamily)
MDSRGELPIDVVDVFTVARRIGVRLSITTGRNTCSIIPLSRFLPVTGPHIASGGSLVCGNGGHPIYACHGLNIEVARQVVEICRHWNLTIFFHGNSHILVENPGIYLTQADLPSFPGHPRPCKDILAGLRFKPLKITVYGAGDALRKARVELEQYKLEFNMTHSDADDIEITPTGVDKGTALREVSAVTGISLEHVMVIGDSPNDLPMFEEAGLAVAVDNAMPEVKKAADKIVPSNNEEGVLWAIQHLALSSKPIL